MSFIKRNSLHAQFVESLPPENLPPPCYQSPGRSYSRSYGPIYRGYTALRFEDLDERQREVVEAIVTSDDRLLVLGGAGTGKTTTALWTARTYLEKSLETPSPRVLFLTFSRAAVSQIMSRSPGVMSDSNNRIEILTFHGLSYWLLRAFGRYADYGTAPIVVQSDARTKLRGHDTSRLSYEDLIPGAIGILERSERLRELIASRVGSRDLRRGTRYKHRTVGSHPALGEAQARTVG